MLLRRTAMLLSLTAVLLTAVLSWAQTAVAAPCGGYCATVESTDPWSYWRLEEGGPTVVDHTGAHRNAVWYTENNNLVAGIQNGFTAWGKETNFKQSSYPNGGTTFSMQQWVKLDPSRFSSNSINYAARSLASGSLSTSFRNTSNTADWGALWVENPAAGWTWRTPGAPFADGNWHMLSITRDSTTDVSTVYLDGAQVYQNSADTFNGNVLGQFVLHGDLGNIRMVSIDEVTVWDHAISGAEVQMMYDAATANRPFTTSLPTITGTPESGQTLVSAPGTWTNNTGPLTYTYRWQCESSPGIYSDIPGATSSSYTLADAQVGCRIRLRVNATDSQGTGVSFSALTATVTGQPPTPTVDPSLAGTERDGFTLSANRGTWIGTQPISYGYQWQRETSPGVWTDIPLAGSTTYALQSADVGRRLRVRIDATNAAGNASRTSPATGIIQAQVPANTTQPILSGGPARDGNTLSVNTGSWTGTTPLAYSYQWQRCDNTGASCADIPGATSASYTLDSADVFGTVRARVTASNAPLPGGAATTVSTNVSAPVAPAPPQNDALPTSSGTARDGLTQTGTTGSWSGTSPITYAYQWLRCNTAGATCFPISGATTITFTATAAEVGATLRLRVTATNPGGNTFADSDPSPVVQANPVSGTVAPSLSGTERDGQSLATSNGTWTGTAPITYTYRWQRESTPGVWNDIAGATGPGYALSASDVGLRVRTQVTASNASLPGGATATQTSAASGIIQAQAPANTILPVLSGLAQDAQLMSVSNGTWTGTAPLTYTYQWQRETSPGSWTDIAAATAGSYTLTGADVGYRVRARVTASNAVLPGGGATSVTTVPSAVVTPVPPLNTTAPNLTGTAQDTFTLTGTDGAWSGTTPMTFAYQWQRCNTAGGSCVDIAGQTATTYTLGSLDVGRRLRIRVTATNAAGSTPAFSTVSGIVQALPPVSTVAPAVSGTERDGQTLTSTQGTWLGSTPMVFGYQWQRETSPGVWTLIAGASGSTYTLQQADVGLRVRSLVTANNTALAGGSSASAPSAPTGVIQAQGPANTVAPALTGTATDQQTLTTSNGSWTGTAPLTYSYQWQKETSAGVWTDIPSATAASYTATSADVGFRLRSMVTASNASLPGGSTAQAPSAPSSPVTAIPPANTIAPGMVGTTADLQTLTAFDGVWVGSAPITYAYQWQRCSAAGASCTDIAGATGSTFNLTSLDVGRRMRLRVTATNPGGSTVAFSAPGSLVQALPPVSTVIPALSGTERDGQSVATTTGSFDGSTPLSYAYQWQREVAPGSWANIPGATSATYVLGQNDVGLRVRSQVTGSNAGLPGGSTATHASLPSGIIQARAPVNTALPAVSGLAQDAQVLSSTDGSWTGTLPISYSYQWQRETSPGVWTDVAGATGSSYTLTSSDVGFRMRSAVTASNVSQPGGTTTVAFSNPTAVVAPIPPINTVLPAITGVERDGQTLSGDDGTWVGSGPITYTYQWQRCNTAGGACVDLAGQTAATHTLTASDVGGRLRIRVTATNVAGSATATSAASGVIAAEPPVSSSLPTLSGTERHGQILTTTTGTFNGTTPMGYTYLWQRETSPGSWNTIPGATAATYTLAQADVGLRVRAQVTASNAGLPGGGTDTHTSAASGIIQAQTPANTSLPVVSGLAQDAQTLTSTNGAWTGSTPLIYTYQWQRETAPGVWTDIASATSASYTATSADVGFRLRSRVTASNAALPGGSAVTAASVPTAVVVPIPPINLVAPALTGTAQDTQTLTGDDGSWDGSVPMTFAYQWQRCNSAGASCADIAGATAAAYTLISADVGGRVRLRVTATNASGSGVAVSANSAIVQAVAPTGTVAPAVTGTAQDTRLQTSTTGTWTGSTPLSYAYQWQRETSPGTWTNIAGATAASYTATPADVGRRLRSQVTASNAGLPGGGSATQTSAPTAVIQALAPANTTAPVISGLAQDAQVMSTTDGAWTGTTPLIYTYQWQRETAPGVWTNIAGATAASYNVTSADVGFRVRSQVTASNAALAGGSAVSASSAPSAVVTPIPPINTSLPTVTGILTDGQTVTAAPGVWDGSVPMTFTYQWQRCNNTGGGCVNIAGQTATTYTLTSTDVAGTVRVVVQATNASGTGTANSNATTVIQAVPPVSVTAPNITGVERHGQLLTATTGSWSGTTPMSYAFQWQRETSPGVWSSIAGATANTYSLTNTDVALRIRVQVTASNAGLPGGGSATRASGPTGVIQALTPANATVPVLSGTTQDGQTMTTTNGTWTGSTPMTYTYQWQREDSLGSWNDIPGATASSYTLTSDDVPFRVRSRVTASNAALPGGGSATANSLPSSVVTAVPPVNIVLPPVTGTETDEQTLTAAPGTWTGTTPLSYTFQWQREVSPGVWTNVAGQTSTTYLLTDSDVGRRLRIAVTATNSLMVGGGSATAVSNPTGIIQALPPTGATVPLISGTAQHGSALSSTAGTWNGTTPMSFAYQWQRETAPGVWTNIAGATGSTYSLQNADVGLRVRSQVTASNAALPGGGSATQTSGPSGIVQAGPPVSTGVPVVTGTVRDGQVVSTTNGTWSGSTPMTFTYQWQREVSPGVWVNILGANAATYNVTPADAGLRLRSQVTASNTSLPGGGVSTATSAPTAAAQAIPPANVVLPTTSGTFTDDQTVTATAGSWTGTTPLTYTYQWQRETSPGVWANVAGATSLSYSLQDADAGRRMRIAVTASNAGLPGGAAVTAYSVPSAVVQAVPLTANTAPVITGTPIDFQTLSVSNGTYSGTTPISYTYQWQRCNPGGMACANIPGANANTYTLQNADIGSTIRAVVTASNAALPSGNTVTQTTGATVRISAATPVNTALPVISDATPVYNQALTVTTGTWAGSVPMTYSYQWQVETSSGSNTYSDISGATSANFTTPNKTLIFFPSAYNGRRLRVAVTASNAALYGGSAVTAYSAPTSPVNG